MNAQSLKLLAPEMYPFKHYQIDNFLDDKDFAEIIDFYSKQSFSLKHTDLFKFLQTDELASSIELTNFKCRLMGIFENILDTKDTYLTIFASYYRVDDYLSCHDDLINERLYAFTYYLEDFESGELVLFNNECDKEVKRIKVKENRLVIFEVSGISYHEVDICKAEGRKAITGWINKRRIDRNNTNTWINQMTDNTNWEIPSNINYLNFEIPVEDQVIKIEGVEYNFGYSESILEGKFIDRRITKLYLERYLVLEIDGYELIYISAYNVCRDNYILLNDPTNIVEGEILDIFIINSDPIDDTKGNINLISEEGKLVCVLQVEEKVMYIVRRNGIKYYIERGVISKDYKLLHMIYRK